MASISSPETTGRVLERPLGIADARGVVADDQHDLVAGVLELAQLAEHDAVAEVQIGAGGIDAELDAQRPAQRQLALELAVGKRVDDVAQAGREAIRRDGSLTRRYDALPPASRIPSTAVSSPVAVAHRRMSDPIPFPTRRKPRLKKLRLLLVLLPPVWRWPSSPRSFGMMMAVASDLPDLENRAEYKQSKNSVIVDDHGRRLGILTSNEGRVLVAFDQINPSMVNAIIAIEDQRFYTNAGVDLRGIARAFVADVIQGKPRQGALDDHPAVRQARAGAREQAHGASRSCARPRWPTT